VLTLLRFTLAKARQRQKTKTESRHNKTREAKDKPNTKTAHKDKHLLGEPRCPWTGHVPFHCENT
jgi:hypothetical protein